MMIASIPNKGTLMKHLFRALIVFSVVFAAAFSACTDSSSNPDQKIKKIQKSKVNMLTPLMNHF